MGQERRFIKFAQLKARTGEQNRRLAFGFRGSEQGKKKLSKKIKKEKRECCEILFFLKLEYRKECRGLFLCGDWFVFVYFLWCS